MMRGKIASYKGLLLKGIFFDIGSYYFLSKKEKIIDSKATTKYQTSQVH